MNSKRISFRSLCVSALLAVLLVSAIPAAYGNDWGDLEKEYDNLGHDWEHHVETDGTDGIKVTDEEKWGSEPNVSRRVDSPQTTLSDDIVHYSNDSEVSSEAQTFISGRVCDGDTHIMEMSDGSIVPYACKPLFQGSSNEAPQQVPTTREILYQATTVIHADGAGLYKRPLGVSYTNKFIPSIVAVTSPTQTHVINLLGHDITITLTATSYEWSWGDGTPNLVTTSTGSVWQDGMDLNTDPNLIRHYYTPPQGWRSMLDGPYPHEDREITLTTTWSGTATNPFTGETQTINGLVTTTETTGKFPLSHLVINNTDTWEEKQGH